MTTIYGWAADESGCGFYRLRLPAVAMQKAYPDDTIQVHGNLKYLGTQGRPQDILAGYTSSVYSRTAAGIGLEPETPLPDVLIGQRVHRPGASALWRNVARSKVRPRMVFEVDDDLWNVDPANETAHRHFSDPNVRQRLIENMRTADVITVSTPHLLEVVWDLLPGEEKSIHVLPNCVPEAMFTRATPEQRNLMATRNGGTVSIGWAGSPTHAGDWAVLERPLQRFLRNHMASTTFSTMGADYASRWGLPNHVHRAWTDSVIQYQASLDFQIGLAPLADTFFNRSKSHLKVLEYAAAGIPVIASDVGPYREFVQHGMTGYLIPANEPEGWYECLRTLVTNHNLRARMGQAAREHARHWDIRRWTARYRTAWTGEFSL